MRDVILPLVLVVLVGMALVARRVLRPALSRFIAVCAGLSLVAYASLELVPWLRQASYFQPVRVSIEPELSFGASADGQPTEIAVQVFRGAQLLDEARIPGLGQPVAPPPQEPLHLERLESGRFRVLAGKTPVGELSGEALAAAGVRSDPFPFASPADATPEVDVAASGADPLGQAPPGEAHSAGDAPRTPPEAKPPGDANARGASKRAPAREPDRELALRARASQLSRQGNACEAERLLREQGHDPRTLELARELEARCRWKDR